MIVKQEDIVKLKKDLKQVYKYGLTGEELAHMAGVSQGSIWELGRTKREPKPETFEKVRAVLDKLDTMPSFLLETRTIGLYLKRLRIRSGLTIQQLAAQLGVSVRTLYGYGDPSRLSTKGLQSILNLPYHNKQEKIHMLQLYIEEAEGDV